MRNMRMLDLDTVKELQEKYKITIVNLMRSVDNNRIDNMFDTGCRIKCKLSIT